MAAGPLIGGVLVDSVGWRSIFLINLPIGLAALVLTLIGTRGIVGRLRDLERRTRQVAAGDFSTVPLPRRDDEVRDLARSVNDMAAKLAALQEAVARSERDRLLGQVSSGLAHQLRNAVTGAKLSLQVHADTCPGGDREALEVAAHLLADALEHAGTRGIDTVFTRPQGLDPLWVRLGFIPVPEVELPRGLRGRPGEKRSNWLLIKRHDAAARDESDPDILEEKPLSVVTGRSIPEIADGKGRKRVWHSNRSIEDNVKAGATKGNGSTRRAAAGDPAPRKRTAAAGGRTRSARAAPTRKAKGKTKKAKAKKKKK